MPNSKDMDTHNHDHIHDLTNNLEDSEGKVQDTSDESSVSFKCPNCGDISRDDVIFLCNTCSHDELIFSNGIYMCPACLTPGENFECMLCGSKKVKMVTHKK